MDNAPKLFAEGLPQITKAIGSEEKDKTTNDKATDEADPSVTVQKINAYEMIGKTQQLGKKMNRQGC